MFSSTKTTRWTVLFSLLTALSSQAQTTSSAAAVPTVQSTVAAAGSSVVSAVSGIATSASSAAVAPVQGTATIDTAGLPTAQVATSLPYSYSVPNLASITANMPVATTVPLESTFPAGAQPTFVSSAPPHPSSALVIADYPALDRVPPTNSTQVQQWLSELDLSDVPNYGQTTGACLTSPDAVADKNRCWWTCGGCTRSTDITVCPDKLDWGLSYDDGPSPYTPLLLDYLNANDIKTTFFVVGSRVLSRPEMVVSEYMSGHQISVHTWSHPYLTNLTNEEIVAELGWTKKVIKDTIGVTPRTFRPPYGDIDDRVRSIAAKMGLTPIIWTTANGVIFDTDDWNIPGGTATGATSLARFEQILSTAEQIDTGFIVLEHDLYQQTVDLAVGYVLPMALNASSPYHLKSISQCLGWEDSEGYIETSSNDTVVSNPAAASGTSFPVVYNTGSAAAPAATGSSANTASSGTGGGNAASTTGGSTTAASAPGTSSSGATGAAVKDLGIAPGLKAVVALGAVALGAALIL